jgi:hypothetical protein
MSFGKIDQQGRPVAIYFVFTKMPSCLNFYGIEIHVVRLTRISTHDIVIFRCGHLLIH